MLTGYDYLEFTSFRALDCSGYSSGVIMSSALNQCSLVGDNTVMRQCDADSGEIIVSNFGADENCRGTSSDTYRLPVGCLSTPGQTSARETCRSAPMNNIFANYGAGLVTLSSSSLGRCEGAPSQANSWTFMPLSTCIATDGESPYIIDSCDPSGSYVRRTFSSNDCSDESLLDTTTVNFDECSAGGNDVFNRQICVNAQD